MKKGTYIDIYVIMACMSHKRRNSKLQHVNELLDKACADLGIGKKQNAAKDFSFAHGKSMLAH